MSPQFRSLLKKYCTYFVKITEYMSKLQHLVKGRFQSQKLNKYINVTLKKFKFN